MYIVYMKYKKYIIIAILFVLVGTRYISMSAYQASRDDELSFVRGAVVKVLKKYVDGWWLVRYVTVDIWQKMKFNWWSFCRYNGGEGFVPGAMLRKFDKRQATIYVKKVTSYYIQNKG